MQGPAVGRPGCRSSPLVTGAVIVDGAGRPPVRTPGTADGCRPCCSPCTAAPRAGTVLPAAARAATGSAAAALKSSFRMPTSPVSMPGWMCRTPPSPSWTSAAPTEPVWTAKSVRTARGLHEFADPLRQFNAVRRLWPPAGRLLPGLGTAPPGASVAEPLTVPRHGRRRQPGHAVPHGGAAAAHRCRPGCDHRNVDVPGLHGGLGGVRARARRWRAAASGARLRGRRGCRRRRGPGTTTAVRTVRRRAGPQATAAGTPATAGTRRNCAPDVWLRLGLAEQQANIRLDPPDPDFGRRRLGRCRCRWTLQLPDRDCVRGPAPDVAGLVRFIAHAAHGLSVAAARTRILLHGRPVPAADCPVPCPGVTLSSTHARRRRTLLAARHRPERGERAVLVLIDGRRRRTHGSLRRCHAAAVSRRLARFLTAPQDGSAEAGTAIELGGQRARLCTAGSAT